MMKSYTDFAYIYDELIDQDYEKWADYIEQVFKRFGNDINLVLDLACGTGNITTILSKRGYDMIGLDSSADMLCVAEQKRGSLPIQYIRQDMTEFELYGTVDAIICTLDGVNYITDEEKLANLFKLAKNYLNPNGLFIFDVNSEYKISEILGNKSFIYDFDNIFYTWENVYNAKNKICSFELTFFVKNGVKYERIDEKHTQRAYSQAKLEQLVGGSNLTVVGCFDELSFDKPKELSERLMFVCKNIC